MDKPPLTSRSPATALPVLLSSSAAKPLSDQSKGSRPVRKKCAGCRAVPKDSDLRLELEEKANAWIGRAHLIAPMDWDELIKHRDHMMEEEDIPPAYKDFMAVLLSNAVWMPVLRKIPYERRVLLLPQCLRRPEVCEAGMDEFGLLCLECGGCSIGRLQPLAESLGYSVVVAEGTTIVTQMIQSGQVEAVIGVSCLSVLERAFPHMAAHAIPGVALPLLQEGCLRTDVDENRLLQILQDYEPDESYNRVDLNELQTEIASWFSQDHLQPYLLCHNTDTERCGLEWMASGGKRWRPLLTVAAYRALTGTTNLPREIRMAAIAVECFHKASLIHDDLVDQQDLRYGEPALHHQVGHHVALNVGDLLIGEGYRLIAEAGFPPDIASQLIQIAAKGHRDLSLGQGGELWAEQHRTALEFDQIIEIFRGKTSPAFSVALCIGAAAARADSLTLEALQQFSDALGIGYQIQDDLIDTQEDRANLDATEVETIPSRGAPWTPSILAVLRQRLTCEGHAIPFETAREEAADLIDQYRSEAMSALHVLQNSELKSLLHRLSARILQKNDATP